MAACSSPQSRIRRNQAAFDAYPPEVQRRIKEGRAEVGFTPEQARMALGRPDRVYTRKSAQGSQEVWAYGGGGGSRVGVGVATGLGAPVFGSVGVDVGGSDVYDDKTRLVFEGGRVVSVESRER